MKMGMGFPIPDLSNLPGPSRPGGGGTPVPPGPTPLAQIDNLNSMSFDGTSDFINAGTGLGNALGSSATNFSVSGWFKTVVSPLPSSEGMFAFGNGPTNSVADAPFFIRQQSYNTLYVESRTAAGTIGRIGFSFDVRPLSWRHYCIVYDGTQTDKFDRIKCYVNGISLTQTGSFGTIPISINLTNKTNFIGAGSTNQYYQGSIDELAIFNVALTEAEVQSIYNATAVVGGVNKTADLSQLTTPPVKWYRM